MLVHNCSASRLSYQLGRPACAFTLVEILGVIFLGCLLFSLVGPLLNRPKPQESWETLHESLNQVATFTRLEAITKRKVYRLVFQRTANGTGSVLVEQEYADPEDPNQRLYKQVKAAQVTLPLPLGESRTFVAVYHGKQNTLGDNDKQAYCYVIPDGMMQPVTVQIAKANKHAEEVMSFQLNPFLGSFERYEGKQKPA